jgi:hypothetical protein
MHRSAPRACIFLVGFVAGPRDDILVCSIALFVPQASVDVGSVMEPRDSILVCAFVFAPLRRWFHVVRQDDIFLILFAL